MLRPAPASFLNLDLELTASTSLSRLARHLQGVALVLYNGRIKDGFRLCAEASIRGNPGESPRACTAHLLGVLEALPEDLAVIFRRCSSRVFDYGFSGGRESGPLAVTIPKVHLARITRLGVVVRITVYPHHQASGA